jgi:hypothetical protein
MTKNVCAAATNGRHVWSHRCAAPGVSHLIGPDHERGKEMKRKCKHPPKRLYSVVCKNEKLEEIIWIGCLDCGETISEIPKK